MPRASGKTSLLIKESAKTGKPIITATCFAADNIRQMAKAIGVDIPKPMSATRWIAGCHNGRFNRIDGVLIDELDCVLRSIFGGSIGKVTYTPKEVENNMEGHFNMNDMYINNSLEIGHVSSSNTMTTNNFILKGKFKTGDIVRLKSVDKMDASVSDDIKKLASSYGVIEQLYYCTCDSEPSYILKGNEGYYINESMFEERTYTKDVIFDINVIVPDKVVEIEFYDGKEKMICHKDDTFDLRKCCFIAIAKHLYKKEYIQEGIEYMSTQLTYQKKYVKIVDKALKDYKRKEKEKEEKIRRQEEEKIIRARQSLKRRKQKERRAQRHREALIDVFADSINEAKARRKKEKK